MSEELQVESPPRPLRANVGGIGGIGREQGNGPSGRSRCFAGSRTAYTSSGSGGVCMAAAGRRKVATGEGFMPHAIRAAMEKEQRAVGLDNGSRTSSDVSLPAGVTLGRVAWVEGGIRD